MHAGGISAHSGGGGTVGYIDIELFALLAEPRLISIMAWDECSRQRPYQHSIDMAVISNTHNEKYKRVFIDMFYGM